MCLFIGLVVIIYIYSGGEKAVSQTQMLQMVVILSRRSGNGIGYANGHYLPKDVSVFDATYIAGKLGKMKVVDTHFDINKDTTYGRVYWVDFPFPLLLLHRSVAGITLSWGNSP